MFLSHPSFPHISYKPDRFLTFHLLFPKGEYSQLFSCSLRLFPLLISVCGYIPTILDITFTLPKSCWSDYTRNQEFLPVNLWQARTQLAYSPGI